MGYAFLNKRIQITVICLFAVFISFSFTTFAIGENYPKPEIKGCTTTQKKKIMDAYGKLTVFVNSPSGRLGGTLREEMEAKLKGRIEIICGGGRCIESNTGLTPIG